MIEGLDISPIMYKNATDKYKTVGTYLHEQGLECDIIPQGSFSLSGGIISREAIAKILVHRDYSSAFPANVIIEKD